MNLNNKTNIAIISHFTFKEGEATEVFPGNIRNFLLKKAGKVVYIDHPFIQSQGVTSEFITSQMRIYDQGAKTYELTSPRLKLPTLPLFIYQLFLTNFFMLWKPMKYDLCIACDNLSLVSVYILRRIGIIRKLVYYTVDYSPKRYSNFFLNSLYQKMDRLASRLSDVNWIAVENMITAKTQNGLNLKRSAPFRVVPIGFNRDNIFIKPIDKINRFNLIFVGFLFEKQGLQLVIEALPKLIKKFPKVKLIIIGSGPYEAQIKKLVKLRKLESFVKFTGYINDHQKIVEFLNNNGGIGLATYIPSIADYTYFADPSKIKLYLLCGLPVVTTKVPPIAKEIAKKKAGFVIDYTEQELINSLSTLLNNEKTYSKFRENTLKLAKSYDTNLILNEAFKDLP